MILPTTKLSPSENVFTREFDGELVLLDLESGVYYGLDAIASRAWRGLCESNKSLQDTATEMLGAYDVDEATLLADLTALAGDWLTKGLAQVRS